MSLSGKTLHVCSCNATMPLDAAALARALAVAGELPVHTQLCQKELARFADVAAGDMIVACTQEARLFGDIAEDAGKTHAIRFVNIRENAGWSAEAPSATPKIAALIAAAALPEGQPVPQVAYKSEGQLLIAGPAVLALGWAERLHGELAVTVLITGGARGGELPTRRDYPVFSGTPKRAAGWLGAFDIEWTQDNPIDLDVCTRCNACIRACPEHAIDWSYQIDLDACRDHRQCVIACGAVGAIDFDRAAEASARNDRFDLVLDLGETPMFAMHQPPQGYWHPGGDAAAQASAVAEIVMAVGEFEKPKFFNYKASICAHSRSRQPGCNLCIDVCSAAAIAPDGNHVRVEPHLCVGCGACTTVCPSGALTYAYPSVPELGSRVRTLLSTYHDAGGRDPCLLLHDDAGRALIERMARHGKGLPARVIPVEIEHMASTGLDVWLGALAYGTTGLAVLATGAEAPQYRAAIERQMHFAGVIAQSLGYQGTHFTLLAAADAATLEQGVWSLAPALAVRVPALFRWSDDKRTTIRMAVEHLLAHAPTPVSTIALPDGAPFGAIDVNRETCTLCLACVGACPEGAILDHAQSAIPQLQFIETQCVQCGLCAATCPEDAIRLVPRLSLAPEAKQRRVLNEAAIFHCTRCAKPLGTEKMIGNMLAKLAGHSMFAEPGSLDRLKMCADCRVLDKMEKEMGGRR